MAGCRASGTDLRRSRALGDVYGHRGWCSANEARAGIIPKAIRHPSRKQASAPAAREERSPPHRYGCTVSPAAPSVVDRRADRDACTPPASGTAARSAQRANTAHPDPHHSTTARRTPTELEVRAARSRRPQWSPAVRLGNEPPDVLAANAIATLDSDSTPSPIRPPGEEAASRLACAHARQ